MIKQKSVLYSLNLSRFYLFYMVVFHLLPRYLYHFIKQPFCRDMSAIDDQLPQQNRKQRRSLRATYDAMFSFLLDGYVELAEAKLAPGTGQIVLFLVELTRRFDEYLDEYLGTGASFALNEVLERPAVQEQRAAFYRYVELFGRVEPIQKYLKQSFVTYYDTYIHTLNTAKNSLQFEDTLEAVKVESRWLHGVMEIVRLFNGHQINDEVLNDFYLFGMIGKFADDMADVVCDIKQGLPNLLYALIRQNPEEYALLQLAIEKGKCLSIYWWKKHCPITYMCYFKHIEHYYQQMKSSKLRMASTLMFLPLARGAQCPTLKRLEKS